MVWLPIAKAIAKAIDKAAIRRRIGFTYKKARDCPRSKGLSSQISNSIINQGDCPETVLTLKLISSSVISGIIGWIVKKRKGRGEGA